MWKDWESKFTANHPGVEPVELPEELKKSCSKGFIYSDLEKVWSSEVLARFDAYAYGNTMGVCEAHGPVIYEVDVIRFLSNSPVWD